MLPLNKIDLRHVFKYYIRPDGTENMVLEDLSFSIHQGEFVTVLGESGGGKTTLLNLMAGLTQPSSGKICIDGLPIEGLHASRSMLFQQPVLIPWLTVKENIAYGCRIRGDLKNLEYRTRQFLEMMGLSCFEHAKPASLSLGMAQRVCLARALVGRVEMLLLDEPFASLDTFTRAHIQEELVNIWLSEGFTAIFVTHDIDEAILLGSKVILLGGYPGKICKTYTIDAAYPRNLECRQMRTKRAEILADVKKVHVGTRRLLV